MPHWYYYRSTDVRFAMRYGLWAICCRLSIGIMHERYLILFRMQCAKRREMKKKRYVFYYANTGIENKVPQIVRRQAKRCTVYSVHAQHCASLSLLNRKMKHFPFIPLTHSNGKQSFPTITFKSRHSPTPHNNPIPPANDQRQ